MIILEIIAAVVNELLKKTMKNKESVSLHQYLRSLKTAKERQRF